MKKYLPLIPMLLFPYAFILTFIIFFLWQYYEFGMTPTNYAFLTALPWVLLGIFFVLSAILTIVTLVVALLNKWEAKGLLKAAMIGKLIQIPAYIIFFIIGFILMVSIFTYFLTIFVFLIDCVFLFFSSLITVAGLLRGVFEKKITLLQGVIYAILSFFFCIDVVVSIVVFCKVRKVEKTQNAEPIVIA